MSHLPGGELLHQDCVSLHGGDELSRELPSPALRVLENHGVYCGCHLMLYTHCSDKESYAEKAIDMICSASHRGQSLRLVVLKYLALMSRLISAAFVVRPGV